MEGKKNKQNFVIAALALAVVVMSVGFAVFSSTLTINGTANITASKWDISFTSFNATASNTADVSNVSVTGTSITYDVTLEPGEVFEYNAVVKNKGTFNAALSSITLSDVSAHSDYLEYYVTYDGTTYSNTSNSVTGNTLSAGATETIKVYAKYILPEDEANLPSTDQAVTLTVTLVYDQQA